MARKDTMIEESYRVQFSSKDGRTHGGSGFRTLQGARDYYDAINIPGCCKELQRRAPGKSRYETIELSNMGDSQGYVEIQPEHVGKALFQAFGRQWPVTDFIGRIMKQDVGKRVFLVETEDHAFLSVENDEQRTRRLGGAS